MPCYYMSHSFLFKETEQGQELCMPFLTPNTRLALLDVEHDFGTIIAGILKDKYKYLGATIPIAGDNLTMNEIADILTKETGRPTTFKQISADEARLDILEEYIQMCEWFAANTGYYGLYAADLEIAKKLHPQMRTFAQFIKEQDADTYFKQSSTSLCAPAVDFCRVSKK